MSIDRSPEISKQENYIETYKQEAAEYGLFGALSLMRLRRVAKLRREMAELVNGEGIHLLDHCIYTIFCDCKEQGLQGLIEEARKIAQPKEHHISTDSLSAFS